MAIYRLCLLGLRREILFICDQCFLRHMAIFHRHLASIIVPRWSISLKFGGDKSSLPNPGPLSPDPLKFLFFIFIFILS